MNSLFIFRRDLRVFDNYGLIYAMNNSKNVYPIFLFTPEQIDPKKNKYFSNNSVQFMIESLKEVDEKLRKKNSKLHIFYDNNKIIDHLVKKYDIKIIFQNMDYTPYAINRDKQLEKYCHMNDLIFKNSHDYLLLPIASVKTDAGEIYQKYTPYMRKHRQNKVEKIDDSKLKNLSKFNDNKLLDFKDIDKFYEFNENLHVNGGRTNAKKILKNLKDFKKYDEDRNILELNTTHLSAYIKFGCVSIREVYWNIIDKLGNKNGEGLINQLIWRDFYYNLVYEFPRVLKGKSLKEKYDEIEWDNDNKYFKAWCNGETGYPVVDAAMKQLNETGYMHNRGRLIVSSFLIKLLQVDWRKGEKYFANQLVDYDPSVNNGNWQWASSSGADSQPYFRIFNPWTQSKKFDNDCIYIKKYLPNLKDVENKHLHEWEKYYKNYDLKKINYTKPIIDYKKAREDGLAMYKKYLN